jgi:hypothetical protein
LLDNRRSLGKEKSPERCISHAEQTISRTCNRPSQTEQCIIARRASFQKIEEITLQPR